MKLKRLHFADAAEIREVVTDELQKVLFVYTTTHRSLKA
jgi:hypothetical protein